ncbi:hypothetical protein [Longimicrobium sp.]|uniref:hypothetical protein n=1 Tax=Longimicrobium sp. TaxID=2029185 RepID=UPI002E37F13B|nr:hypothetical protein [Longimicrobium sp.]HEX6040563.1 hypothetical protein [Longimicrobium sp.]
MHRTAVLKVFPRPGIALLVAVALLITRPLAAQGLGPDAGRESVATVITFSGIIHHGEAVAALPLPFDILEQIERDPNLVELCAEARVQTGPALTLTFAFPNVEAYRTWFQAESTRRLLSALRQRVSQFEASLRLVRNAAPGLPTGA